jgi:hypothetical protein
MTKPPPTIAITAATYAAAWTGGHDWDTPRFGTHWVRHAIGCDNQWLTNVLNRRPVLFPLSPEERVQLDGRTYFLLSFRSIFGLALIRELGAALPLLIARKLSEVCMRSDWLFPADMSSGGPDRFLIVAPKSLRSKMLGPGEAFTWDAMTGVLAGLTDDPPEEPLVVVNATALFNRVVEGLDIRELDGELMD